MAFDARKAAWTVLNNLEKGRSNLDKLLEAFFGDQPPPSRRDRAFFNALVYGVTRWRSQLDYIISCFSRIRLDKIDPKILNILRLALFQIIYLDRIPNSAAVNTAVELTKITNSPWAAAYINAVLRRAASQYREVRFPDIEKDPIAALASAHSFPPWMISRWLRRFGREATAALCSAINTVPPITIRTNTLKTSLSELLPAFEDQADQIQPTLYSPDGISFHNPKSSIPELKGFKFGWFQVQDEAAQMVTLLLNPLPGERVLDACAGLGGKTGHIAQCMKNKGSIMAIDNDAKKLSMLEDETRRLGVAIVSTRCHDLEKPCLPDDRQGFDRTLLDAPCSGLGVIRRNPDIKWRISEDNLAQFKKKQLRLLENLHQLVKPSGVLVYAVCSLEPEENEEVVDEFLKKHPEFGIDLNLGKFAQEIRGLMDSQGFLRTLPHLHQMDGFFAVRFRKIA
jgi:16S rRNA (cytosine967-C5)-methyltransferase